MIEPHAVLLVGIYEKREEKKNGKRKRKRKKKQKHFTGMLVDINLDSKAYCHLVMSLSVTLNLKQHIALKFSDFR